jgi:NADPH-dependent 2,4-dienoyl-CoA reductase/sulfur reductase-like enzyme
MIISTISSTATEGACEERISLMTRRLVVVGGNAGGLTAASQARYRVGPDELEIVAFERGNYASYSSCGIPFFVSDAIDDIDRLVVRTPDEFRDRQAIEVRIEHDVIAIDTARRVVTVVDRASSGGDEYEAPFDALVIATGAVPRRLDVPGAEGGGVFGVQTLDDGVRVRDYVHEVQPASAVIVGGGYIGLELAEALLHRGLSVTLVEAGPQPMSTLDPDMGELVADALRHAGAALVLSTTVSAVDRDSDGHVCGVVAGDATVAAELVVFGLGTHPNGELARLAGIAVGETGGIVTDRRMRTRTEGVWAAGDCVETLHLVSGRPVAVALGTHATKQGRVAGIDIAGGHAAFPGVLGTAVTRICDLEIGRTGLNAREAEQAGFEFETYSADATTRAGYLPNAEPIRTKFVIERAGGRVLGAQICGGRGAAKRIDTMAVAITRGVTVDELLVMDLGYAPPLAPTWDPLLVTARRAVDQRARAS